MGFSLLVAPIAAAKHTTQAMPSNQCACLCRSAMHVPAVTFSFKDKANNVTLSKDAVTMSCSKVSATCAPYQQRLPALSFAGVSLCQKHRGRVRGLLVYRVHRE